MAIKKFLICLISVVTIITSSQLSANEKLTVLLDWFPNPDHAPLFVAESRGFFKKAGLDVQMIAPADPDDPPKLVAANRADIAITYEPAFLEQVDQGLPLIRLATLIDKPLACVAVLQDSSIRSVQDFKGKRIGYSTGGLTDIAMKTMLETHGMQMQDVSMTNVHYDLTQALLSKKMDAVSGVMRTFEIIQMQLAGHPARIFLPEDNGVPPYDELILVVNKNKMHDPRFLKFLVALQEGVEDLQKHPDADWKLFIKTHPELNDPLDKQAWFATLPYFAKHPASYNAKQWETFARFMQKNGLIQAVRPMREYAVS